MHMGVVFQSRRILARRDILMHTLQLRFECFFVFVGMLSFLSLAKKIKLLIPNHHKSIQIIDFIWNLSSPGCAIFHAVSHNNIQVDQNGRDEPCKSLETWILGSNNVVENLIQLQSLAPWHTISTHRSQFRFNHLHPVWFYEMKPILTVIWIFRLISAYMLDRTLESFKPP